MTDERDVPGDPSWTPPWREILAWIEAEVHFAERRYRLPEDERDELRQLLCVRVLEALARFVPAAGPTSLEFWVRRHATWGVADYWRRRLRRERRERLIDGDELDRPDDDSLPPSHAAQVDELRRMVRSCLEKLTPVQRDRLLAAESARESGEPLHELARRIGVARDTLKEALGRARASLRRCLHANGVEPTGPWRPARSGGPSE